MQGNLLCFFLRWGLFGVFGWLLGVFGGRMRLAKMNSFKSWLGDGWLVDHFIKFRFSAKYYS